MASIASEKRDPMASHRVQWRPIGERRVRTCPSNEHDRLKTHMPVVDETYERVRERLRARGFELVGRTTVGAHNARVPGQGTIVERANANEKALVIVFGNDKSFWPSFVDALRECDVSGVDAFDAYVEREALEALREAREMMWGKDASEVGARVFWAKDTSEGKVIAIQRMAHVAGLAYLDERTHQSVNAKVGPWFALRGAFVFDSLEVEDGNEEEMKCPVNEDALERAAKAFDIALANYSATGGADREQWRLWLAARDAMCGGEFADHRYGEDQIHWHYQVHRDSVREKLTKSGKS